jgi:integrase
MIATAYRPSRRKNGKRIVGRMYRGKYRLDPRDKTRDVPLHTNDKQVAEQRLRRIIQEEQHEREGIIVPKQQRDAAGRSLARYVEEYIADRRAVGRDEKYVRELRNKLLRLIDDCSWQTVRQVSAESFCSWRTKQKKAGKTLNEYLIAVSGFMTWLEPRIGTNPLRFVRRVQTNGVSHRARRAFSEDELQRLIMAGGLRGVVYLTAARTGIRRGELEQIEWRDVHLDTTQPFIMVRASVSKNHRHAMQPLPPDAVEAVEYLRSHKSGSYERVFAGVIPRMMIFKVDLEAAGIPYTDSRGEHADFHSLRKTFGTMLTLSGVGQRTVMELMRHSDMRLTAKTYTDANMLPISDAMASLMRFAAKKQDSQIDSQNLVSESPGMSAPVPLNVGEPKFLTVGDQAFSPLESASVPVSPELDENARCRVRTCDLSPRRPLLSEVTSD